MRPASGSSGKGRLDVWSAALGWDEERTRAGEVERVGERMDEDGRECRPDVEPLFRGRVD